MMRLSRRHVALLGLTVLLLAAPGAEAEGDKVFRLGLLVPAGVVEGIDVFVDQMRRLGYEEGRNLVLDRHVVETAERNAAIAVELVELGPDVLLGSGKLQVEALKRATGSILIVFAWVADPVGNHIVDSLARPGGNATGTANFNPELTARRLEMMSEVVPGAARIAILFDPRNAAVYLRETEAAAATRGIVVIRAPARLVEEVPGALQRVIEDQADALMISPDLVFYTRFASIIEFAVQNRLPTIFSLAGQVRAGGLMSYGVDPADSFRRAADLEADRK